jgi:hypothetical protein
MDILIELFFLLVVPIAIMASLLIIILLTTPIIVGAIKSAMSIPDEPRGPLD